MFLCCLQPSYWFLFKFSSEDSLFQLGLNCKRRERSKTKTQDWKRSGVSFKMSVSTLEHARISLLGTLSKSCDCVHYVRNVLFITMRIEFAEVIKTNIREWKKLITNFAILETSEKKSAHMQNTKNNLAYTVLLCCIQYELSNRWRYFLLW